MLAELVLACSLCQVTAYRPVPWQNQPSCTDRNHCWTSIGQNFSELGIAVSQDMLKDKRVKYGDVLCVDGFGCRIVYDCMNERWKNAVDLSVYTKAEEKKVGVKHRNVYVLRIKEDQAVAMINAKKARKIIDGLTKQFGRQPTVQELRAAMDGTLGKNYSVARPDTAPSGQDGERRAGGRSR